jgi:predicted O-methyltransferase YrrM
LSGPTPWPAFYLPISADAGRLLYALVRASRPDTVVEFGTSFGISTIYLAAAVADNGRGRVITTELSSTKAEAARSNLRQAGVDGPVTVLVGDARQTLADLGGPIGLVLLDGWKDLDYVRDPDNGYVTVAFPVEDGMEISSWTGP